MTNRNKLISLILMSITGATTLSGINAQAAINLEVKDGVINNIQMFASGIHVYEGYKDEEQDIGLYYSNGFNDREIEDINGFGEKYGINYLNFKDDDMILNLITGEEEESEEDKISRLKNKFKTSVVRKVDRYKNIKEVTVGSKITENNFGPVWYEAKLSNKDNSEEYNVYLSDSGRYIDVSETLNITHYSKITGEKIRLNSYDDLKKKGYKINIEKTLFMDSKYIYKVITIVNKDDRSDNGIYIQKISYEESEETKKGAVIPKSVDVYEQGDLNVLDLLIEFSSNPEISVRVSGNFIYIIKPDRDNGKISVERYKLKKIKEDLELNDGRKIKVDKNVIEIDDDFDAVENEDMDDFEVDLYGTLWILDRGKIKRLVNGELETVFTVDRTMNNISVFDENNLAVWNSDEEMYSIYNGNTKTVDEEMTEDIEKTEQTFKSGWIKNEDNTWCFINSDGSKKTGWLKDNGNWYMLKEDGIMATGWYKDKDENWYYLKSSGEMAYNETVDGYYLGSNGVWVK